MRTGRKWIAEHRVAALWAGVGLAVAVLGVVFVALPGMVVDHDLGSDYVQPQDRLSAINNVRTTLLQSAAGIVLFFGAYATWRQLRVSQETLRITQEGHLTEQFGRAIDQLGGDKLDVRIGGIHALWRLAEHSAKDRQAVVSTMAAFLRVHQPWPPADPDANDVRPLETRAADSQLALTCLGVLCQYDRADPWLNLSLTDLRRGDFDGLHLPRVNLDHACLESATLYSVDLTRASLVAVNLQHASMPLVKLTEARCVLADFRSARLAESVLDGADFTQTDLREANLRKVSAHAVQFRNADLRAADLRGADLDGSFLDGARFEGALASDETIWPDEFDPAAAGVTFTADPGPEPPPLLQPPSVLPVPQSSP